jgi:putative transposase
MPKRTTKTNWQGVNTILEQFGPQTVNPKDHFRFGKLECTQLATVRTTRHAKYNINYHFVWIPKTRAHVLQSQVATTIKNEIIAVCKRFSWIPLAMEVMPEHIHFFMSAPPKYAPATIMQYVKGVVSKKVREKYPILKKFRKDDLWADSYYVGTAGHISQEQVIRYIAEQNGQQSLKPFTYSIFQKAQKTLADFAGG